jgi:tetratricopeptide (TPR) repeat protein
MDIREFQEPPKGSWEFMEESIKSLTRQYEKGTTKEVSYHSQLTLIYSILKQPDKCRFHAAMVPDDADADDVAEVAISMARISIYEKNLKEAIAYYEKCLRVNPDHAMALDEIAWCCYHEKRFDEAEKWFREMIPLEEDPERWSIWQGLGLTLSELKRYDEARSCFEKEMSHKQNKTNVHYYEHLIGLTYSKENDFYRALAHYTKSLDAKPAYAPALNDIAALYFEQEADIKTAIGYLKNAEEVAEEQGDGPTLQLVYVNLIRLYGLIAEYDLQELYNSKLLGLLGFGDIEIDEDDDDDNDLDGVG